jgi:hypothetical protein
MVSNCERQTLADFKSFLILKKQFDDEKTSYQQDKKNDGQQVEIALDKMPHRCPEFIDKAGNNKKTGRAGQY